MFYTFQAMVSESWNFWSGLFDFMPYGDPYGAAVALFLVVATTCKMVVDGKI